MHMSETMNMNGKNYECMGQEVFWGVLNVDKVDLKNGREGNGNNRHAWWIAPLKEAIRQKCSDVRIYTLSIGGRWFSSFTLDDQKEETFVYIWKEDNQAYVLVLLQDVFESEMSESAVGILVNERKTDAQAIDALTTIMDSEEYSDCQQCWESAVKSIVEMVNNVNGGQANGQ